MKKLKLFILAIVSIALLSSIGFSIWVFEASIFEDPVSVNGAISVAGVEESASCSLLVLPSTTDGFTSYTLNIRYGKGETKNQLDKDVDFLPSITFIISDYEMMGETENIGYYLSFNSESDVFDSVNGYIEFDTTIFGQNQLNPKTLEMRDNANNLKYTLDEDDNPLYELKFTVTPIFKYKSGKKPSTREEYKALLDLLNDSISSGVITLHIVSV